MSGLARQRLGATHNERSACACARALACARRQPEWYHDGKTPEQIREKREASANSQFLGGDIRAFDSLFPSE
jgi:hypothetical protein